MTDTRQSKKQPLERTTTRRALLKAGTIAGAKAMQLPPGVDAEAFLAKNCAPLPANLELQVDSALKTLRDENAVWFPNE